MLILAAAHHAQPGVWVVALHCTEESAQLGGCDEHYMTTAHASKHSVRGAHSNVHKPQRSQCSACTLQRGCVCARAKVAQVFSHAVSNGPN